MAFAGLHTVFQNMNIWKSSNFQILNALVSTLPSLPASNQISDQDKNDQGGQGHAHRDGDDVIRIEVAVHHVLDRKDVFTINSFLYTFFLSMTKRNNFLEYKYKKKYLF